MPALPEAQARQEIDRLYTAAGWHVCGVKDADINASRGVAIREFPLEGSHSLERGVGGDGPGCADFLRYIDGKAAGVVKVKKIAPTLTGAEIRSAGALHDRWHIDFFPRRLELSKALAFAIHYNHTGAIVGILCEKRGHGDGFAQKITCCTTCNMQRSCA